MYRPPQVDRIWFWSQYNKISIYPIFYLVKGDYKCKSSFEHPTAASDKSKRVGAASATETGVPKLGEPIRGPYKENSIFGSILGFPYFGQLPQGPVFARRTTVEGSHLATLTLWV